MLHSSIESISTGQANTLSTSQEDAMAPAASVPTVNLPTSVQWGLRGYFQKKASLQTATCLNGLALAKYEEAMGFREASPVQTMLILIFGHPLYIPTRAPQD